MISNWKSEIKNEYVMVRNLDEVSNNTNYAKLEKEVTKRLKKNISKDERSSKDRCLEELTYIKDNHLADIFLLLREVNNYCSVKTLRRSYLAFRGTIYNSYVAYLLNITCINPLDFDLPIEFCTYLTRKKPDNIAINVDNHTYKYIDRFIAKRMKNGKCEVKDNDENVLKITIFVTSQMDYLYEMQTLRLTWRDIPLYDHNVDRVYYGNSQAFGITTNTGLNSGIIGTEKIEDNNLLLLENPGIIKQMSSLSGKDILLFMARLQALTKGSDTLQDNGHKVDIDKIVLKDMMCCREDIFDKILSRGIARKEAFEITNEIRLGKGISEENERKLELHGFAQEEINTLRNIKYIFPRGHALGMQIPQYFLSAYKLVKAQKFYDYFFENIFDYESFLQRVDSEKDKKAIFHDYQEGIYMIDEYCLRVEEIKDYLGGEYDS